MWYLYIVKCSDESLYTGITTDVDRRVNEHNNGIGSKIVRSKLPAKLVYQEECKSRSEALKREAAIKKLSRVKKLQLVQGL